MMTRSSFTKIVRGCLAMIAVIMLTSCSAELSDYKAAMPKFDLFNYFEGSSEAWGMVQDYTGKQTRRFHVTIEGKAQGDTLILDEQFIYNDGETDSRVWTITRNSDGSYTGKADDIIGVAQGAEEGNALRWRYDFLLKTQSREIKVHFDDWLYRQDETHLFNVSSITKWGIEVAKVTLFFSKS